MMGYYGDMFGWGLGPSFMMVIFWLAIILFFVWLVKEAGSNKDGQKPKDSALDILKERYARGEIGKEEFELKKKDLS